MSDNNTQEFEDAREGLVSSIKAFGELIEGDAGNRLFPNGINKISFTAKFGGAELTLDVEGPTSPHAMSEMALFTTKNVTIKFGANAEGTLTYGGTSVPCLGSTHVQYAKDLTVKGALNVDKFRMKHSDEFDADMPFAVLIMGQRGIYIHDGEDNLAANGGESSGCIHLATGHAEAFWNWVDGPTRILISYPW